MIRVLLPLYGTLLGFVLRSYGQVSTTSGPSEPVNCTGAYSGATTRDELYRKLLPRVLDSEESEERVAIKRVFLNYLTRTPLFLDMIKCKGSFESPHVPRLLQEDEDGDDEDGGGGVGGAAGVFGALTGTNANPNDNTNVLNGVRRILANVFTGNLVGVLQESVSLRSPEAVTTVFTDVLSTLFGSAATAGITGIVGNMTTTTPSTLNATSTLLPPGYEAYIQQHYLQQQQLLAQQQQQQLALLQQQQQLFVAAGGVGGGGQQQVLAGQQPVAGQQFVGQQQGGVLLGAQQLGSGQAQYLTQHQHLLQQHQQQQVVGNRNPVNAVGSLQNQPIIGALPQLSVSPVSSVRVPAVPPTKKKPTKQVVEEEEEDDDD